MEGARPLTPRAVVLASADVDGGQTSLLHSCEDCACEVATRPVRTNDHTDLRADREGRWIRGSDIVESRLDDEHHLLFNPLGSGGVVVINDVARRIFARFTDAATIASANANLTGSEQSEARRVTDLLRDLEMIQPADRPTPPAAPATADGQLLTAWLHLTNDCNLRCPYCYLHKSGEAMDQATGLAAVDAVVRSALDHGFPAIKLKYAGGEASLNRPLLLSLHEYARARTAQHGLQLHATLLSNGVALPGALIGDLRSAGIRIMISLDGIGDRHDVQRPFLNGNPSFAAVERTIARLIAADHRPHLSITVTNRNADGLPEVVRFALERDLTFSLNFFRDNECAAPFADLQYAEQSMISALLAAFEAVEQRLPRWSVLGSILDRGQLVQPRMHACGVGRDYVVIDQRGRVAKCHMEIERTLGDVFQHDLLDLVRNDRATVQNLPVIEKEGCRDCTWRFWCSGGCSVATFRATGRYDVKSPNCNIYRAIYPPALRLEGLRLLAYANRPGGSWLRSPE